MRPTVGALARARRAAVRLLPAGTPDGALRTLGTKLPRGADFSSGGSTDLGNGGGVWTARRGERQVRRTRTAIRGGRDRK